MAFPNKNAHSLTLGNYDKIERRIHAWADKAQTGYAQSADKFTLFSLMPKHKPKTTKNTIRTHTQT
jgi:hypothetical protein